MINALNHRYRKHIAWLLFLLFYGELAATLYAGKSRVSYVYRSDTGASQRYLAPPPVLYDQPVPEPVAGFIHEQERAPAPPADEQAFIDGPGQPEMSSFRSVGADNMVNLFTGDFSYNIPLLDVGGYPVNLFYNAGITMDQEASWVGLGWNLNPGTVSRNMRGLPDDFNKVDEVINTQTMKPDLTIGVNGSKNKELFGMPALSGGVNVGIFYNNRRGLGLEAGLSTELSTQKLLSSKNKDEQTFKDTTNTTDLSISAGLNLNSQNGMSLSGGVAINLFNQKKLRQIGLSTSVDYNSRQGLSDLKIGAEYRKYKSVEGNLEVKSNIPVSSNISFARSSFVPSIRTPLTRTNQTYSLKLGKEAWGLFANAVITGYVNESRIAENDRVQKKPAYGYMYMEEGKDDKDALLDFNRMNDGVYTYKRPVISLPAYTYDVFTINGEGTGGSFRGYRGNIGNVKDNLTDDRTAAFNLSLDLGAGRLFHGGTVIGGVFSPSQVTEWKKGNALRNVVAFKPSDKLFQGFYFKNPGEKAIIDETFYNAVGGEKLIRPFLQSTNSPSPLLGVGYQVFDKDRQVESVLPMSSAVQRSQRDKRTQVITYLTAEEATDIGLDKKIYSFKENQFLPGDCNNVLRDSFDRYLRREPDFYRKRHHISEVDVLEGDGKRYVYGIPVYQIKQKEFTFSTDAPPSEENAQLVKYNDGENTTGNKSGADGSFHSQELGGYAHSFLLTAILSPDYVDVTGNGISDDDHGSAVKFNYSRMNKANFSQGNYWQPFKWRMPLEAGMANFNEGLKADAKDNKALYTYGEKELWYLHSIESKNMVAVFWISPRNDGNPVENENGVISSSPNAAFALKKLDSIDLYTKAEFMKNGVGGRPVKRVHFEYNYELCPNYPLNKSTVGGTGKLTLKAVWFSYNGNNRQKKNKYEFKYGSGVKNPAYNTSETDRWGTYKRGADNPSSSGVSMSNADYPYTLQAEASNQFAAAWNIQKILTPSGATMEVTYEADDYAFVQDKRASQMMKIAGFGFTATTTPTSFLYTTGQGGFEDPEKSDNRFVFFDPDMKLTGNDQVKDLFLKDFKQLLLRIWVEMPRGNPGSSKAYEPVTVYGKIKSYGILAKNGEKDYFYVELEKTHRKGSPIMETVLQFLKDQLPQRAYPGYNVKDKSGLMQLVSAVWGMFSSLIQGVMGFEQTIKMNGACKKVNLDFSFGRIHNADPLVIGKKGGGHRVKKIVISDNWSKLTKGSGTDNKELPDSYYGQEYEYKTKEIIGSAERDISSGVASYEPGVGNEENPFREVLQYAERQFLGPTDFSNVELPLAETFFPSPMVGYSKVSVRSIHNKTNKRIKSGMGLQETEYYTTRDFPVITDFTSFDQQSRKLYKPPLINQVLNFNKKDYVTLTQGFRIILNDMNGKIKSQTSYPENDYKTVINSTRYYYRTTQTGNNKFKLDNILPVVSGPDGRVYNKLIGKEVEVMNDFREHFSYTYAKQIPLNLDVFGYPPFMAFIPSILRMGFRDESMFRSATTLKVINEYGILDSIVNNDKGSVVSTKNLVYDAETGDVLLTRTQNEFKKPVYQFSYPAWWKESGMEPAYRNIDMIYKNVLFRNGRIEESPHVDMSTFESGDELYVVASIAASESIGCQEGGFPPTLPLSSEKRIWALYTGKDTRNTTTESKQFIFIDRYGNPYSAAGATIRVVRSGKRNLTGTSIGSVVSLENPVRDVFGITRVQIDDFTKVINASAMRFEEKWRSSQMFYTKDTVMTVTRYAPVRSLTVASSNTYTVNEFHKGGTKPEETQYFFLPNEPSLVARQRSFGSSAASTHNVLRSFVMFDLSMVNPASVILSAKLNLRSHRYGQLEDVFHRFTDETADHNGSNPLYRISPASNRFRINRLKTDWPADNNLTAWKAMYSNEGGTASNEDHLLMAQPPSNTHDYILNTTTGADNRIDVLPMFRAMLRDKNDPARNYAPGLRITIQNDGDLRESKEKWVCFWGSDPAGGHLLYRPRIDVQYYNCAEAYGLPGNPASPAPGEQTVACVSREVVSMCLSVYDKQRMNPYIQGILGNWRPLRSYVFYGERREEDITAATNLSKDGVIKNYVAYWTMTSGLDPKAKLDSTTDSRWTWNSVIAQYNRKGAELENQDALGRYNSGIYGYQETLPLAVVNNSSLRLSGYDGFEDYKYADTPCGPFCNPHHRHFNTGVSLAKLDSTQAHTGKYSFRIPSGSTDLIPLKVTAADGEARPDEKIEMVKTAYTKTVVNLKGIGLKAKYYNHENFGGSVTATVDPSLVDINMKSETLFNIPYCKQGEQANKNLPAGVRCFNMSVEWVGKIQVDVTGTYEFDFIEADDYAELWMNTGSGMVRYARDETNATPSHIPVTLTAGTLYTIQVKYRQVTSQGYMTLFWKKPGATAYTPVEAKYLYPEGKEYLADNNVVTQTFYCEKPGTIQAIDHQFVDSLNLIPGQKMVASVWVKKGTAACQCASYTGVNMYVKNAGGTVLGTFAPKERVIEGWQQYEVVFTVPATIADLKLEFGATGADLFVDDLRLHPFNANMKSFVYDPVTLRLAAELDENNFATFYEYDDEGTPVRVKKETRQGIKTITETRSSMQKNAVTL